MFTEAEPEEQTESTTCSFPTPLFAACPHTRVNRRLIETAPHTHSSFFPSPPLFISSFIYGPLAPEHERIERVTQHIWVIERFCSPSSDRMKQRLSRTLLVEFCSTLSTTAVRELRRYSPSRYVSLRSRK